MDLVASLVPWLRFGYTVCCHIASLFRVIGLVWSTTSEALHLITGQPMYRIVFEWGYQVRKLGDLKEFVRIWLKQVSPAMLPVQAKPVQLVTLPSTFFSSEAAVGRAV